MGFASVSHHHVQGITRIRCAGACSDHANTSFLGEVLGLEASLADAQEVGSKSIHIATDSSTLRKLCLGREQSHGADVIGHIQADAVARVLVLIRSFDEVFVSHVRAHSKLLLENTLADLLAGLACEHPGFTINSVVTPANHAFLAAKIASHAPPRNCTRCPHIPHLVPACSTCNTCNCPSHDHTTCYLRNSESFPSRSIHCKIQPARPPTFSDQVCDPASIDWSSAPASISYQTFTRFYSICINNLRKEQHAEASLYALQMFSATYRLINGHISKAKPRKQRADAGFSADATAHLEQLARDAKTAARLARNHQYRDAMKTLDRQQPIGPLHTAAIAQLPLLYPDKVHDAGVPAAASDSRVTLDRHVVHRYVKGRSATSSPGVSGVGFGWTQLFARLTVALEDDEHEDPNWTIFVAFIEDLSCGSLPWLRNWATSLKGCLFNKTPDPQNIKLRNLGIAESFVRIAAHMVTEQAIPYARTLGLISPFDLGIGVPGGCEKFVKLAQVAAELGSTILSCDLEKAFNNVLRRDVWAAVQFLNCPLMTSWFCFFFHQDPVVHFAADPSLPFSLGNSIQYTLYEGVAQGDPAASFLFNITVAYILREHRARHPLVIRTSIHDDLAFHMDPSCGATLPLLAADLSSTLRLHNLTLNNSKTVVFCSRPFAFPSATVPFSLSHDGFHVCQIAVGTPAFCETNVVAHLRKIDSAEVSFTRLHSALKLTNTKGRGPIFVDLLRLCFRSRFSWAMRTLTPAPACRVAKAADEALSRLLHLVLPYHPPLELLPLWQHLFRLHAIKIALPVIKGGLGLRPWLSLTEIAHFSSWVESGPRVLLLLSFFNRSMPPVITQELGASVAFLSSRFAPEADGYWQLHPKKCRHKTQHELTEWIDNADIAEGSSLSHDPAVNAQFIGSCSPAMCLPFNSSAVPRHILDTLNETHFKYALAWHTMQPLFPASQCACRTSFIDPLGLHFLYCNKFNGRNLLHNSVRDCFAAVGRKIASDSLISNIVFQKTDAVAKSATYIHHYYPLKDSAPPIVDHKLTHHAPSLSPDMIVAFSNAPHRPYFLDFVASSPSLSKKTRHGEAAQIAYIAKRKFYSEHHLYPADVFYPMPFERSGFLHPAFVEFMDFYVQNATPNPTPQHKLKLHFAVAYAITFTTAAILHAASPLLYPDTVRAIAPPQPATLPISWAPDPLPSARVRRLAVPTAPAPSSDFSQVVHGISPPPPPSLSERDRHGAPNNLHPLPVATHSNPQPIAVVLSD